MAKFNRKYYTPDPSNPEASGICDRSGFVFKHSDLVQQMEWRGESLEWTGLMVGAPFLDKPNEQLRNPPLYPDPVPVDMPKPPHQYNVCWSNQIIPWSNLKILNWVSWSGSEDGILASPENERLQALEENRRPAEEYPGGAVQFDNTQLDANQILQSLESYNWSAN